ncbi:hypothetical protein ABZY43_33080, partial [Streptomyces syringium]|uniref:hypothetical protein n=1 Tax=Streptomyces syringium TaxID=76729 RepID=UPI00339ED94E
HGPVVGARRGSVADRERHAAAARAASDDPRRAAPPAGRLAAGPAVGGGYRQILALWDRPQIVQTLLEGDLGFTA